MRLHVLDKLLAVASEDSVYDADDLVEVAWLDVMLLADNLGWDIVKFPISVNLYVTVRDAILAEEIGKAAEGHAAHFLHILVLLVRAVILRRVLLFKTASLNLVSISVLLAVVEAGGDAFRLLDLI